MTLAMFRVMFLTLLHDRGALVMAFLLPIVFFLVLAEIFSSAAGGSMQLRVATAIESEDANGIRLVEALRANPELQIVGGEALSRRDVEILVRKGTADVGVVLRADARPLDDVGGFGPAPLLIVSDPVRGVAVAMLSGQIQRSYFEALPDVALGSVVGLLEEQFVELEEEQKADIEEGLAELREAAAEGEGGGWSLGEMLERQDVAGQSAATNHVAYYAGAVAFLFLLFSCMQGATTLLDERASGILERILAGPGGVAVLVTGKFLFLVAQGFVQMLIIFVVAWQVYGVDLPAVFPGWSVVTLIACITAAGLSLLIASVCNTRAQAQNFSTIVILIMSVVGGSMVPRFFMPEWLRDLGWFTPNTWVLESYSAIFWRGEGLQAIWLPCTLLLALGLVCFGLAQWFAARSTRL